MPSGNRHPANPIRAQPLILSLPRGAIGGSVDESMRLLSDCKAEKSLFNGIHA